MDEEFIDLWLRGNNFLSYFEDIMFMDYYTWFVHYPYFGLWK